MKHEFTDQQIIEAFEEAELAGDWEAFKRFLDALPEPATDDWQECGFNELHATDKRVKAVFIGGSIIEGTPDRRNSQHVFLVDGPVIHSYDDATFYRIPAPVEAPDPDNNPVILVREVHGKTYDPPVVAIVRDSSTQNHPVYVYAAFPDYITDWSPARVVADDE